MLALDLCDHPLPERKRLCVRIIDAENCYAQPGPVEEDALQLFPHPRPVFALKIKRVNVLILFRRILSILNRAIGPLLEPVLMLLHIWVVRRRLKRNVERNRKIQPHGLGNEALEVVDRSKIRMNLLVPTIIRPNGPRAAKIALYRLWRIIAPLPKFPPDRMNRRQIHDVEAQFSHIVQSLFTIRKRAMLARLA